MKRTSAGTVKIKRQGQQFGNYCLFCLEPQDSQQNEELIKENCKKIGNFQPILHYLTGTDPTFDRSVEECRRKKVPVMSTIPPMCSRCSEIVGELYCLHEQLIGVQRSILTQTEKVRGIVGRANLGEFLTKILSSDIGLAKEHVEEAVKFTEELHKIICNETRIIFPSKLPIHSDAEVKGQHPNSDVNEQVGSSKAETQSESSTGGTMSLSSKRTLTSNENKTEVLLIFPDEVEENTSEGEPSDEEMFDDTGSMAFGSERDSMEEEKVDPLSLLYLTDPSSNDIEKRTSVTQSPQLFQDESLDEPFELPNDITSSDSDPPSPVSRPRRLRTRNQVYGSSSTDSEDNTEMRNVVHPSNKVIKKTKKTKKSGGRGRGRKAVNPDYTPYIRVGQECDFCKKRFSFKDIFQHIQTHTKDFAVKCPNSPCQYAFSCTNKLKGHNNGNIIAYVRKCRYPPGGDESTQKVLQCPTCNFNTEIFGKYVSHIMHHEELESDKPILCPVDGCSEKFSSREAADVHIFVHPKRHFRHYRKSKCSVCGNEVDVAKMEMHLREEHQITEIFKCKHCTFLFHSIETRVEHLWTHRVKLSGIGVACDICPETVGVNFPRMEILREHYFRVHQVDSFKLPLYYCEYCTESFTKTRSLNVHIRAKHSEKKDKLILNVPKKLNYPCDQCLGEALQFRTREQLVTHKITVHEAPRLPCKICSETFTSHLRLNKHMKNHAGIGIVAEFKCDVEGCERKFRQKKSLHRHKNVAHSAIIEKPFVCDACGKGFVDKGGLKNHINMVHLHVRNDVCETCGESFASSTSLKKHKLIHTGEKPFSCPICGQSFRHKNAMQTHVKSHETKGDSFKPTGPMKHNRKRVERRKKKPVI